MEGRKIYQYTGDGQPLPVTEGSDALLTAVAAPILAEGDLLGLVLFITSDGAARHRRHRVQAGPDHRRLSGPAHGELNPPIPRTPSGRPRFFDGMKRRKAAMLEVSPTGKELLS